MNSNASAPTETAPHSAEPERESWGDFAKFVAKLVLAVVIFRSFFFSPFTIPSESMLPRLINGDYLVAAKWPYGFSRYSLPFNVPLIPGRLFANMPERGDVVIFKHPVDGVDYVKRAIGLPGDTIAMRDGELFINGDAVKKERIDDFVIPLSENTQCHLRGQEITTADGPACRYMRFRETLPSGRSYEVLDFGPWLADNMEPIVVPEGRVFMMGDNRDNSQDSRFAARPGGGVGLVDSKLLVGRAAIVLWSTDGSARWLLPWTWFTSARWGRIGNTL